MNGFDPQLQHDIEQGEAWLRRFSDPQPAAGMQHGIKQALRRELQTVQSGRGARRRRWMLVGGAAAAVFAAVLLRRPADDAATIDVNSIARSDVPGESGAAAELAIPDWPEESVFLTTAEGWDGELSELEEWNESEDWSLGGASLYDLFETVMADGAGGASAS